MSVLEKLDPEAKKRFAQFLRGCKLCAEFYREHVPDATSDDWSIWDTPGIWDLIFRADISSYLTIAPTSTIILGVADHIALCEQCRALVESVVIKESVVRRALRSMPDRQKQLEAIINHHRLSQQSGGQQFDEMVNATVSERELLEECSDHLNNMVEMGKMLGILVAHIGENLETIPG